MLRWLAGFLAVFCLLAVTRLEWLDHQAGGAIGQKLMMEPDVKWVIDKTREPEMELRNHLGFSLMTWGVALHGAAMVLVFLSLFQQARDGAWRSGWAGFAALGMALLGWAFFRQYFAALGW